ncbi:purine nucleoside phosphorylase [Planoprotostelium fungivorum]|uniref:purine-nucleoside phosphorylase n=1 Tax=Planoprotostelium fungivorum TaxID=1890364 RepID=A0A2P6NR75_9EUKA|nr:purine nucleoside phosphorylase [Planoprotostelium fungivorum]
MPTVEYYNNLKDAAGFIVEKMGRAEVAIVLGSGLNSFTNELSDVIEIPYVDIPHMPEPTVAGHSGKLVFGHLNGKTVYCLAGRSHSYEGRFMFELTFMSRMLALAGVRLLIATNASGGAGVGMTPGCLMVIRDHLNMYRRNPLQDTADHPGLSHHRHPDCSAIYSERVYEIAKKTADRVGVKLFEGVYASTSGPTYETPNEVKTYIQMGATAFGMSTIPETMAGNAIGMEIFAVSLITNLAAGMSEEVLTHSAVTGVANESGPNFVRFMKAFVGDVDTKPIELPVVKEHRGTPLPKPQIEASTSSQIEEAAKAVQHALGDSPYDAAIVLSTGHEAFSEQLINTSSMSYDLIPHLPSHGPSGGGKMISGTDKSTQKRLLLLTENSLEGFQCEEAVFLSELLSQLKVPILVHTLRGVATRHHSEDVKGFHSLADTYDTTTIHPYSHRLYGGRPGPFAVDVTSVTKGAEGGVTYAHFPGPSFPTPAEVSSLQGSGSHLVGITATTLLYACNFAGMTTSGVVEAMSDTSQFSTKSKVEELSEAIHRAMSAEYEKKEKEGAHLSEAEIKRQITFFLAYPVVQGVYTDVVNAAEYVKSKWTDLQPALPAIIVDHLFLDSFRHHIEGYETLDIPSDTGFSMTSSLARGTLKGGERKVIFLMGAGHMHTGLSSSHITIGIRLLKQLGVSEVLHVSPFCSVHSGLNVSDAVIVQDHVSLCGRNPLFGINEERWGTRFPDMGEGYSTKMTSQLMKISKEMEQSVSTILYGHVIGPVTGSFAEASWAQSHGLKALSTGCAPEAIVARHSSLPFAAIGLVTASVLPQEKKSEVMSGEKVQGPKDNKYNLMYDKTWVQLIVTSHKPSFNSVGFDHRCAEMIGWMALFILFIGAQGFNTEQYLSTTSPYPSPSSRPSRTQVPEGCQLDPIHFNYLSRHGSREIANPDEAAMFQRLEVNLKKYSPHIKNPQFEWMKNWTNPFASRWSGQLSKMGRQELYNTSLRTFEEFSSLFTEYYPPTFPIRSTQVDRTSQSASSYAYGIWAGRGDLGPQSFQAAAITSSSIDADPILRFFDVCPKFQREVMQNSSIFIESDLYLSKHIDRVARDIYRVLQLSPVTWNLTSYDISSLYTACSYDVAMDSNANRFCLLFSQKAAVIMDYAADLREYYQRSYGTRLAVQVAAPLLSHFFEVLQSALDGSGQKAYLRFAHGETILPLAAIMGLFANDHPLTHETPHSLITSRKWRGRDISPYAANIALVTYNCSTLQNPSDYRIKILYNEREVLSPHCGGQMYCPLHVLKEALKPQLDLNFTSLCT